MASKLTDGIVKALPSPATGSRIYYDSEVRGFGCRVTAAGARAFVLNYRTRLGRERRFTIGAFPDWKTTAARVEAAEMKKEIDRGGDPLGELQADRSAPTVNDLADRFVEEYLPRKRGSTAKGYRQIIDAEIRPALGRIQVAELTFSDIDDLHRAITKRGRPWRANRVMATLSRMLSMAMRWNYRPDNPARGIEKNDEPKRRRYLTAEELPRLIETLAGRGDQSADIVRMLLLTGARSGEVMAAQWADIDLKQGIWSKPATAVKQRREHIVPLNAPTLELLSRLRTQQPPDCEWVFPAGNGHRKDIKDAWISICKASNIKGLRVHDLRHSYASLLASGGASLPLIGALLGHSSPSTTARYAHLFHDVQRAATERVGAIITGQPGAEVVPISKAVR
jgi:integrase